jgi:ADP-ribose diphosphatase
MAPTFFNSHMNIVIAQDLYPQHLEGDEPEPLEVVPWSFAKADELLARPDFLEARGIAALFLAQRWLKEQ